MQDPSWYEERSWQMRLELLEQRLVRGIAATILFFG